MSRLSDAVLSQSRKKFARVASAATGAILAGRDGTFSVHGRTYISVWHWEGKVTIEVVIDECLWRKFRRSSRNPTLRASEIEAFQDFQRRGRDVLLEQLRRTLSEVLHVGVSRGTLRNVASAAKRRLADA